MDVLVTWKDGTQNVVNIRELVPVRKGQKITLGVKVKMFYGHKWWYGTITVIETEESASSEEEPLSRYATKNRICNNCCEYTDCNNLVLTTCFQCACFLCAEHYLEGASCSNHNTYIISTTESHNSNDEILSLSNSEYNRNDTDNETYTDKRHEHQKYCGFLTCTDEVFSACHRCLCLLCYEQFLNDCSSCEDHSTSEAGKTITESVMNEIGRDNIEQSCEFPNCTNPALTTCFDCACLLCDMHFEPLGGVQSCSDHFKNITDQLSHSFGDVDVNNMDVDSDATVVLSDAHDKSPSILRQVAFSELQVINLAPEDFVVEGAATEGERTKPVRRNKYKEAKLLRHKGKEHISPYTKKVVPEKKVGPMCNIENCAKQGKYCYRFSEEQRGNIFRDFYSLEDLTLQREYITRFVDTNAVGRKTTAIESRRKCTYCFYLPLKGQKEKICQKMFLSTLGISEKTFCTSMQKLQTTGIIEKEKRGERQKVYHERDAELRSLITEHINRFPRVESHYCRKDSTKEYLHHDLSLRKMFSMFLEEYDKTVSITLYRSIFNSMNLSFHRPKKDQCSLCITYREGTNEVKEKLQIKYDEHINEKEKVRRLKNECKTRAMQNITSCSASFDLQQVIYLPQSNESALFYKRRLANYNFTIYDLSSKDCVCNLWNETISRRGASEICTCLYNFLTNCDRKGVKELFLFCDGCSGQNKNSVMAAMLLYFINHCESIEEISLRYFCSFHGQSEGDSVHSAVAYAMSKAGNIFVPCQLEPIIWLARKKPYKVKCLNYDDFKNFKDLSSKLKLLQLRKDDQTGDSLKWTDVMEFKLVRSNPTTLFFKTSHMEKEYRSVSLKRQNLQWLRMNVEQLNKSANDNKITKEKYDDLLKMCSGDTPLIRSQEHVLYYKNLPHY